jgi:hypothetical protein
MAVTISVEPVVEVMNAHGERMLSLEAASRTLGLGRDALKARVYRDRRDERWCPFVTVSLGERVSSERGALFVVRHELVSWAAAKGLEIPEDKIPW